MCCLVVLLLVVVRSVGGGEGGKVTEVARVDTWTADKSDGSR